GPGRPDHLPADQRTGRLRTAAPGPRQGFRLVARRVRSRRPEPTLGPAHDPVRRTRERAGNPGPELGFGEHERAPRPGHRRRTAQRLALLFGQGQDRDETAFVPEVHAGFISVIDGLARDHPVLVVFEDAHTLKAPMLDLIERLGTRGAGPRRALILTLARNEL